MIFIEVIPDVEVTFPLDVIEKAALAVLAHQAAPQPVDLTIQLTDDQQLHHLNRDFLGVDAPTDVLSFPAGETDPETGLLYLGDIAISVPRALVQAEAAGHDLQAELQLLTVHGVLHLLGHDHADLEEKAQMWQAQAEILAGLGLPGIRIQED
jgi:probable rRNA maturation factor